MLVHLSNKYYQELKKKNKNSLLEDENNITLKLYDKCNDNFYRMSDKNFIEEYYRMSESLTLKHIVESFKKPHNT